MIWWSGTRQRQLITTARTKNADLHTESRHCRSAYITTGASAARRCPVPVDRACSRRATRISTAHTCKLMNYEWQKRSGAAYRCQLSCTEAAWILSIRQQCVFAALDAFGLCVCLSISLSLSVSLSVCLSVCALVSFFAGRLDVWSTVVLLFFHAAVEKLHLWTFWKNREWQRHQSRETWNHWSADHSDMVVPG